MRWLSRVVSVVVTIAIFVGVALLLRSKMPATSVGGGFFTCAAFRDATKLAIGSHVMIAGVRVGEVTELRLEGAIARVEMRLVDETSIPIDSWVTKRAYSPFGDSFVEIIPTGSEPGAPTGRLLRSGECIHHIVEGATTDTVLRSLNRVMPKADRGLERLNEVGTYGRKWASGTLEDAVLNAEKWLDEDRIARPLASANTAMERLESATTRAADAVAGARPDIIGTFDRIDRGVAKARKQIAELNVNLKGGLKNTREGMDGLDTTIDDYAEVLAAVNEGRGEGTKGTLGRLINDPQLGDTLDAAAFAGAEGVGSFNRFKSWLGLRIEFNVFSKQPRFFVTAEVRARTDKFYLVELEKGPLGDFPDDKISDAINSGSWTRQQQIRDSLRFTVQFGKTFGNWFQIRGGIKESTFGFGADMLLGSGRLKFSSDIYGGFQRTPRLKLAGALAVFRSVYLIAGIDDTLTSPGYLDIEPDTSDVPTRFDKVRYGRDYFVGGTLHFDDADLSLLLRVYGALIVGLL